MKAMRIIGYGEIERNVILAEVDKPEPGEDEVLIEVHGAGVNPIDFKIIDGLFKQISPLAFPAPLGFDVSGRVVKKGSRVKNFQIGEEVYSRVSSDKPGTFAEFIAVDSTVVVKKPPKLSFEEAAGIPLAGLTTVQSFEAVQLKEGDRVLIHAGSGGVGSFAIQYAKAKGAYVYTTTSTKNVDWVKKLGADRVIDYKKENYMKVVKEADVVFDTLGHHYTADAFKVIKEGGKVVSIAGTIDDLTARSFEL
ncbi:MAG: NADP-dependent oxidoreductase, partial [Spirochaetales bacterium]|nr:NADP-dependent oxidoreductase [Spirochaetales bacterium]